MNADCNEEKKTGFCGEFLSSQQVSLLCNIFQHLPAFKCQDVDGKIHITKTCTYLLLSLEEKGEQRHR